MKKHYPLIRLFMLLLMTAGWVQTARAVENSGDSIYNIASNRLQTVVHEINQKSLYYQNIPAIRNFLDGLVQKGNTTLQTTNRSWQAEQQALKAALDSLYDEQVPKRTAYEEKLHECIVNKDIPGLLQAQAEYEQLMQQYDNNVLQRRGKYNEAVSLLAQKLNSEADKLQQRLQQSADDQEAATQLYTECNNAEWALNNATEAQQQSDVGKALRTALSDTRTALNGTYAEVGSMVNLLKALLDLIQAFNQETTAIATAPTQAAKLDVYTMNGLCVRRQATLQEAARQLPAGLYIANGKKIRIP